MKNLLIKELRLAFHPAAYLFLALSAMLLIPNYPYYVVFFYGCLGVFFVCINGRENQDVTYCALLPIRKADIVKARFVSCVSLEAVQVLLAVLFAVLRAIWIPGPNAAGMDANAAFFGLALVMLGLFNLIFFPLYYKNPLKVGVPFLVACVVLVVYLVLAEAPVYVVPYVRDVIDTPDPANLTPKLLILAAGLILYSVFTYAAYRMAKRRFERIDL